MQKRIGRVTFALALVAVAGFASYALAGDGGRSIRERLHGYQEVPSVSTKASGRFEAQLDGTGAIRWRLEYAGLEGAVTQAHIHFAQADVNGGISVWLCSNLASPPTPAGTQACPQQGAVTGTATAEDVVGPAAQGITAGELAELVEAIQAGKAYANVHSATFPGGEIRAQLKARGRDDDDD